ncbi:MAG: hypothetical protein LQ345_002976 [Seirophora villosa]|nr:MAG: hypothetical protein LQ345_002976 [Seirophora villosa]
MPPKIFPAHILWLLSRPLNSEDADGLVPAACFNHPVIVLSANPLTAKASVLIVNSPRSVQLTSFAGEDNFPFHNETVRAAHLPIHPCDPHPDTGILLFLREGMELRKRSWVKIDRVAEVGWNMLGVYELDGDGREREFVLDDESWELLEDAMRAWNKAVEKGEM